MASNFKMGRLHYEDLDETSLPSWRRLNVPVWYGHDLRHDV